MDIDDSDGLISFNIKMVDGTTKAVSHDLLTIHDAVAKSLKSVSEGEPFIPVLRGLFEELGFPDKLAESTILRIQREIYRRMGEVLKKDRPPVSAT